MRIFSLLSLVVVLLIVAVVAKKQLGITQATAPAASAASGEVSAPVATNPQQARQLTQQVQQDVARIAGQDHGAALINVYPAAVARGTLKAVQKRHLVE